MAPEDQAVPSEVAQWAPRAVADPLVVRQVARRVNPLIVRPNSGQAKMEFHSPRKRTRSMSLRCRITRQVAQVSRGRVRCRLPLARRGHRVDHDGTFQIL